MTREEQIRQASIEYTCRNTPMCIGGGAFSEMVDELNRNKSFEEGAKWADKTMIEKACEYLKNNIDPKLVIYHENTWTRIDKFIDNFRETMKNS